MNFYNYSVRIRHVQYQLWYSVCSLLWLARFLAVTSYVVIKLTGLSSSRGRSDHAQPYSTFQGELLLWQTSLPQRSFVWHLEIHSCAQRNSQTADEVHRSTYKGGSCENLLWPNLSYTAPWALQVKPTKVSAAIAWWSDALMTKRLLRAENTRPVTASVTKHRIWRQVLASLVLHLRAVTIAS